MKKLCPVWILLCIGAGISFLTRSALADYKQAVAYYTQGRFDKTIQELKPDLDQTPEWEFGHRLMGLSYLNLKNNALAISSLTRAVQLKSTTFSTYQGLGQAYFNMQRFDNSVQILNQGQQFAKGTEEEYKLYHLRGSAYYRMERFNEAVNDLTAAIRNKSADWADFSQLGIAYYNLNRYDEAIQALLRAIALKPGQNATTEFLGKSYFKKGVAALSAKQYDQAIDLFRKAQENDLKNGFIPYNIAEAYLFKNNFPEAEKNLNRALELMPRSAEVFQRLGLVYEKQKKWDLALNAYQKANELKPSPGLKEAIDRINELKKR
ncbi:MAG: tetratricopeptide repeat protein [Candidatus Binatia bacterium]